MTPIAQALALGYGEEEILKYLSKAAPSLSKSISKAINSGNSTSSILGFLSKTMSDDEYDTSLSQEAGHKKVAKRREKITKDILKTAASSGALYGAARAVPSAIQGFLGAFPAKPPAPPNVGPTPMGGAPISPPPITPAANPPQPPLGANAPSATQQPLPGQQPPGTLQTSPSASSSNSINIINHMGLEPQIKSLQQAGNSPEAIAAAIGVSMRPTQKKWLDDQIKAGTAKPLADMITDVMSQPAENEAAQGPIQPQVQPEPIQAQQPEVEPEEIPEQNLEKGHLVATPNGEIGEIKSIRNGKALIDEDGKLHQVEVKDLESLTNKYKDVHFDVSTVPEKERSAPLYGISANRDDTALTVEFFPRDSTVPDDEYEYFRKDGKPFDKDILKRLKEGLDFPGTSNIEWNGFWNAEKADSRGSASHKELIMKSQDVDKIKTGNPKVDEAEGRTLDDDPNKPLLFKKKEKLFRHGFERLARKEFAKHSKEFKKEYQEMTGVKKRKKRTP